MIGGFIGRVKDLMSTKTTKPSAPGKEDDAEPSVVEDNNMASDLQVSNNEISPSFEKDSHNKSSSSLQGDSENDGADDPSLKENLNNETLQEQELPNLMNHLKIEKDEFLYMLNMNEKDERRTQGYYQDRHVGHDIGRRKSIEELFQKHQSQEMDKMRGFDRRHHQDNLHRMDPREMFERRRHRNDFRRMDPREMYERRHHSDFLHDMMDMDMMEYDEMREFHRNGGRSFSDKQDMERGKIIVPEKFMNQVLNNGGGYSFQACDMTRLQRFIVLGCEESSYYASSDKLMPENVQCVHRLIANGHHKELLDLIEKFSHQGRVPKEDPILVVLSICATDERIEVRQAAYEKVNAICNIPTKLFRFIEISHAKIESQRKKNPPQPELRRKRKDEIQQTVNEPVEHDDEDPDGLKPKIKKVKKPISAYKAVHIEPKRSIGWGRQRRNAIAKFYTDEKKNPCRLLYLLTKYKQRHNWSHQQVLTYAHPKISGEHSEEKNLILKYCARGYKKVEGSINELAKKPGMSETLSEVINYMNIIHEVSNLKVTKPNDEERLLEILSLYGVRQKDKEDASELAIPGFQAEESKRGKKSPIQIVREHLPTQFLNKVTVWEALLVDMPMTAMIRNLGKMTSMGMFNDGSKNTQIVVKALNNENRLRSARVHPMKILLALLVYKEGKGEKGNLEWEVNIEIKDALNSAFYKCFKTPIIASNYRIEKKFMLCIDISDSMTWRGCVGCPSITPALASIAMAMVTWNVEEHVEIMGFGNVFMELKSLLNKDMTIEEALKAAKTLNAGSTDCTLPMKYALIKKIEVDCFVVYTDNETNCNSISPVNALKIYNQLMNRDAKLIVCGMQLNEFTVADPNDPNCLDVVGFDSSTPDIMSNFARGDSSTKCNVCQECKVPKD